MLGARGAAAGEPADSEAARCSEATVVVLLREGSHTIMSVRSGCPGEFVELEGQELGVVSPAVFDHLDALSAPRLVDYWERDPCKVEAEIDYGPGAEPSRRSPGTAVGAGGLGSARLEIPDDGGPRATVQVEFDSPELFVPLGLGSRELVVYVIARDLRYQAADAPNLAIPTNLRVKERVRGHLAEFYAALLDHLFERNPGAVVSEHVTALDDCDTCPAPLLSGAELAELGADRLPRYRSWYRKGRISRARERALRGELILTRLHLRHDRGSPAEQLQLRPAGPLLGGVGAPSLSARQRAPVLASEGYAFVARYLILHEWPEPITCDAPHRGSFARPRAKGREREIELALGHGAVEPRAELVQLLFASELDHCDGVPLQTRELTPPAPDERESSRGCAHCAVEPEGRTRATLALALVAFVVGLGRRFACAGRGSAAG